MIEITDKRVPVVLGLGGNNTQEILNTLEEWDFTGVDAILSVSPYYNRPSQRGIYQHYKIIGKFKSCSGHSLQCTYSHRQ